MKKRIRIRIISQLLIICLAYGSFLGTMQQQNQLKRYAVVQVNMYVKTTALAKQFLLKPYMAVFTYLGIFNDPQAILSLNKKELIKSVRKKLIPIKDSENSSKNLIGKFFFLISILAFVNKRIFIVSKLIYFQFIKKIKRITLQIKINNLRQIESVSGFLLWKSFGRSIKEKLKEYLQILYLSNNYSALV